MSYKNGLTLLLACAFLLASCTAAQTQPPAPTPTLAIVEPTLTASPIPATAAPLPSPIPAASPTTAPTLTPPPSAANPCTDPQAAALLEALKTAILNADGPLLGSLVSPNGMEVRYFRNGNVITYTPEQARFLFETTYEANWGPDPASGIEKTGAFQNVIVPKLRQVFESVYTLHCNELPHGGATYEVTWPYAGDFYAIYFAGTEQYSNMDWNTWGVGLDYLNGKPYIRALAQYFWEP